MYCNNSSALSLRLCVPRFLPVPLKRSTSLSQLLCIIGTSTASALTMFHLLKCTLSLSLYLYAQSLLLLDIPRLAAYWIMFHSTLRMRLRPRIAQHSSLSGQTGFLSGATGGIGKATATILLENGIEALWVTARNLGQGQALVRELEARTNRKGVLKVILLDQNSMAGIVKFDEDMQIALGDQKLDFAIINAGVRPTAPSRSPSEPWDLSFQINVVGSYALSLALIPHLKPSGVLNFSGSSMQFMICPSQVDARLRRIATNPAESFDAQQYEFTKFLQQDVARYLARRVEHDITVSSTCVGYTNTGLYDSDPMGAGHWFPLWVFSAKPKDSCHTVLEAIQLGPAIHNKIFKDGRIIEYMEDHHSEGEEERWRLLEIVMGKAVRSFADQALKEGSISRNPKPLIDRKSNKLASRKYEFMLTQLLLSAVSLALVSNLLYLRIVLGVCAFGVWYIWTNAASRRLLTGHGASD